MMWELAAEISQIFVEEENNAIHAFDCLHHLNIYLLT